MLNNWISIYILFPDYIIAVSYIYFSITKTIMLFVVLGVLCAECESGYSPTMDLLSCKNNCNNWGAGLVFVTVCKWYCVVRFKKRQRRLSTSLYMLSFTVNILDLKELLPLTYYIAYINFGDYCYNFLRHDFINKIMF